MCDLRGIRWIDGHVIGASANRQFARSVAWFLGLYLFLYPLSSPLALSLDDIPLLHSPWLFVLFFNNFIIDDGFIHLFAYLFIYLFSFRFIIIIIVIITFIFVLFRLFIVMENLRILRLYGSISSTENDHYAPASIIIQSALDQSNPISD